MTVRLSPGKNAPAHDLIMTPSELAREIVAYFDPSGRCLDPCRGKGAFYDALRGWPGCEVDWYELAEGRDFLQGAFRIDYDWLITNPPWSKLRLFLLKAMGVAENVVFLSTITHFVTRARLRDVHAAGFGFKTILLVPQPPAPWPGAGFQLAAVHLRRGWCGEMRWDQL